MPKESRPLGKRDTPKVFQGVPVVDTFPTPNLDVTLDAILEAQEEQESLKSASPSPTLASPQPTVQASIAGQDSDLKNVPVDLIDDAEFQPRLVVTDEEQDRLTASIAIAGRVNRPVLLRKKPNGRYELLGGTHRLKSVRSLGWPTIPARIVDVDDAEAEILALSDNEGHKDLTDFEKGRAYSRILATGKVRSARALAERVGASPATITRCLAFMKLPDACVSYLESNPSLLGSKLVANFVEHGSTDPELTYEALVKIDQEGISQEAALRWLSASIAEKAGRTKPLNRQVSSLRVGFGGEATLTRSKDSISLKLPKGADMDLIEKAIRDAIERIAPRD